MEHESRDQLNVVMILTDDQGAWALGAAGNSEIRTPHLDALAQEGVRFENFFCTSPVCSPARASLLTGEIPSQHGVHDWVREGNVGEKGIEYIKSSKTYTEILASNGYRCSLSGKWHLGNSQLPQKGFTNWYAHQRGGGDYYDAPMIRNGEPVVEEGYITDLITDHALTCIDRAVDDKTPFYAAVHYTAPHTPWLNQHPEEFVSLYNDCPFNSCPTEPLHPWSIFVDVPDAIPPTIVDDPKEHLKGYYGAISAMDANVGRILKRIDEKGIRERTLVIFMSDNGFNCGHHGIWGKGNGTFPQNMFDTSIKVPAIFSLPGRIRANQVRQTMASGYDLMPTLLDFLDIPYEDRSKPGRSIAASLTSDVEIEGQDRVVVYDEYGPVRMIRTRDWKYVHRYPYGPHELYNLQDDPQESVNLYDDVSRTEIVAKLRSQMEEWFDMYVYPEIDGTKQAVTGKGQIGIVGRKGNGRESFQQED